MDLGKFTEKAQSALSEAQNLAARRNQQAVDAEHLLLALLKQENGLVPRLFVKAGANPEYLIAQTEQALTKQPAVTGAASSAYITQRLNQLLLRAQDEAKRLKDEYVSVEHLALALFDDPGTGKLLADALVTRAAFLRAMNDVRGNQRVTSANPEDTYEALEKYGRDLTEMARQNKLDPVIGRDMEIRRVIQVLSRRTKKQSCANR